MVLFWFSRSTYTGTRSCVTAIMGRSTSSMGRSMLRKPAKPFGVSGMVTSEISVSSNATPPTPPQQQPQRQLPQSTPQIAVARPKVISIILLNCNGLQNKINFLKLQNIVVVSVHESKFRLRSCNGYNNIRLDRTRSG